MKTLTINISNEKDLSVMEEILTRFGLNYQISTDHNFSDQEIQDFLETKQSFLTGNTTARNWNEVKQDLDNAFN